MAVVLYKRHTPTHMQCVKSAAYTLLEKLRERNDDFGFPEPSRVLFDEAESSAAFVYGSYRIVFAWPGSAREYTLPRSARIYYGRKTGNAKEVKSMRELCNVLIASGSFPGINKFAYSVMLDRPFGDKCVHYITVPTLTLKQVESLFDYLIEACDAKEKRPTASGQSHW